MTSHVLWCSFCVKPWNKCHRVSGAGMSRPSGSSVPRAPDFISFKNFSNIQREFLMRKFYLFSHVFTCDWKDELLFSFAELGNENKKNNPAPGSHAANHLLGRLPTPSSKGRGLLEKCLCGGPVSNIALTSLLTRVGLPPRPTVFHGTETQHVVLHIHLISLSAHVYFGACTSAAVGGKMHISSYHPSAATSCLNCWLLPIISP